MNAQNEHGEGLYTRNPHIRHADRHPVSEIEWARIRRRNHPVAVCRERTDDRAGTPSCRPDAEHGVGALSAIRSHGTGDRQP